MQTSAQISFLQICRNRNNNIIIIIIVPKEFKAAAMYNVFFLSFQRLNVSIYAKLKIDCVISSIHTANTRATARYRARTLACEQTFSFDQI